MTDTVEKLADVQRASNNRIRVPASFESMLRARTQGGPSIVGFPERQCARAVVARVAAQTR
jgi:hypothetical protein